MLKQKPAAGDPGSGFGNRLCALLACFCQRREHDRQPATFVVVMPNVMAVTVLAKHCLGLYLRVPYLVNLEQSCKILCLTAWYKRARLHNVDLPFHIRPFNILIAVTKNPLNIPRSFN